LGFLKEVSDTAGGVNTAHKFTYAPSGLRIRDERIGSNPHDRRFAYTTSGLLMSVWESGMGHEGAKKTDIIYANGEAIAEIVITGATDSIYELHNDYLGSPRHITNGNLGQPNTGHIIGEQAFGPYGERVGGTFAAWGCKPITGYTGHINEDLTGLIYMRGRYYSPLWHRFVSSDQGVDPLSLNQFAYVGGMPFMATDPWGMAMARREAVQSELFALLDAGDMFFFSPNYTNVLKRYAVAAEKAKKALRMGEINLPPCEVRLAIMDAVEASDKPNATDKWGGYHEEGGIWGLGAKEDLLISPALPGLTWFEGITNFGIDVGNAVDPSINHSMETVLGQYHVHPKGGSLTRFVQSPSAVDIGRAVLPMSIVAGAASKRVYFYDATGDLGAMSFKKFMKGCEKP
jgi:RHS repeat-associated protein